MGWGKENGGGWRSEEGREELSSIRVSMHNKNIQFIKYSNLQRKKFKYIHMTNRMQPYTLYYGWNASEFLLEILLWKGGIVLYQFLETGTSDRCLICIVQNLRFSGFSLYPLSLFLYSPFKSKYLKAEFDIFSQGFNE